MRYTVLFVTLIFALLVACTPQTEQNATSPTGNSVQELPAETLPQAPIVPDKLPAGEEKKALYTVEGTEGDLIQLKPEAVDPDGEKVAYTFTKPFDMNGRWQTRLGDEGKHDVVVGASDGKLTTTETVRVIVHRANRPPVIDCGKIVVNEAEQVDLHDRCTITDEDDSEVVVSYSGWMDSWRYTTTYDDAGTHTVIITASDKRAGKVLHTVTKNVDVVVRNVNRPPQFGDKFPTVINAFENDIITMPRGLITDPDGDKLTITYSMPFNSGDCWKTKLGDAGTYDVDVVASDGNLSVKRTVKIKIALLNTPPVLNKLLANVTGEKSRIASANTVLTCSIFFVKSFILCSSCHTSKQRLRFVAGGLIGHRKITQAF